MKKTILIFIIGLLLTILSLGLFLATHQKEFFGICLISAIVTSLVISAMIDNNLSNKS